MGSVYDQLGVSRDLATDGVRHDFGDGRWMKLAHAHSSNKRYAVALQRAAREHKYLLDDNQPDTSESRAVLARVYAEAIVLDIGGSWERDGVTPTAHSVERVVALLTDPELPTLFDMVQELATNRATFALASPSREAVGNSEPSRSGE